MVLLTENSYLAFKSVKLMQNIAFIPFLLNNTSSFIHPLNSPPELAILSSFLPYVPVLDHICLL